MTKARDNADTASGGLVHINTTTASAVSSQSINDVFSTTYDNYRVVYKLVHSSAASALLLRVRVSATDATAANYNVQTLDLSGTSASAGRSASQTSVEINTISNDRRSAGAFEVYQPFLAEATNFTSQGFNSFSNGYGKMSFGEHTLATSYTGFTLFVASGTITGTISVYGYKK